MYDNAVPDVDELQSIWNRKFFIESPELQSIENSEFFIEYSQPPPQITMDEPQHGAQQEPEPEPESEPKQEPEPESEPKQEPEPESEPEPLHDFEFVEISDAEKND